MTIETLRSTKCTCFEKKKVNGRLFSDLKYECWCMDIKAPTQLKCEKKIDEYPPFVSQATRIPYLSQPIMGTSAGCTCDSLPGVCKSAAYPKAVRFVPGRLLKPLQTICAWPFEVQLVASLKLIYLPPLS